MLVATATELIGRLSAQKLRHPPPDVAAKIAADPTGNERKIWVMQVIMARTLMISTIIHRAKVG
eukprot:COSAG04_NODE_18588_length_437_cov_1.230769_2_plen_64_part_00